MVWIYFFMRKAVELKVKERFIFKCEKVEYEILLLTFFCSLVIFYEGSWVYT